MLQPAGDAGVAAALMPMLMTQVIENLDNLPVKITADVWLAGMTSEYARHLRDFPLDILKAACDAHVRGGSQFFPKVFELTKHATPALELRKRQQWRIGKLVDQSKQPKRPVETAFVEDPQHLKLLTILKWQELPGSRLFDRAKAETTRRELAQLAEDERVAAVMAGRPIEEWATADYLAGLGSVARTPEPEPPRPVHPAERSRAQPIGDVAQAVAERARPGALEIETPSTNHEPWRAGQPVYQNRDEPPMPDVIPEAQDFEA